MEPQTAAYSVADHFAGRDPAVAAIYARLLDAARGFGPVTEEPKKTSIHLVRRTAFAGIATRRTALILTLKARADIASPRIGRHERASAGRWHLEVRLESPADVDPELIGWLRQAYDLAA